VVVTGSLPGFRHESGNIRSRGPAVFCKSISLISQSFVSPHLKIVGCLDKVFRINTSHIARECIVIHHHRLRHRRRYHKHSRIISSRCDVPKLMLSLKYLRSVANLLNIILIITKMSRCRKFFSLKVFFSHENR